MRFFRDMKKYGRYVWYSVKSELKNEVAGSYLNWLWWFLDPIFFMMVYTFIAKIVFSSRIENFPVFVFIGLSVWNFFNKVINSGVKVVKANKSIISKIYIPKHTLLWVKIGVNFVKMMISFGLVFVLMLIYKIEFTPQLLHFIPLTAVLVVFTFACASILLHIGVFIEDMGNIVQVLLRLTFYMSGVFYAMPKKYARILLNFNPVAALIDSYRNIMLYQTTPDYKVIGAWFGFSVLLAIFGVRLIYKYENSYAKIL